MNVLHTQYKVMMKFEDLVEKDRAMPKEVAEPLILNPIKEISKSLHKVFRESNIVSEEVALER